jgi:hypothetical protein
VRLSLVPLIIFAGCSSPLDFTVAPTSPLKPIQDQLIIPGYRVGPIALGVTETQLLEVLGDPTDYNQGNTTVHYWWKGKINVVLKKIGGVARVVRINVEDESYEMNSGIGVGSSILEMRARLGEPTSQSAPDADNGYYRFCYGNGIQFQTIRSVVSLVTVWSPGCSSTP